MLIDDGTGRGYKAEVNPENELVVRAITETQIEHAADHGRAYSWDSLEINIDAGDTMLFVQNNSTTPLLCDRLILTGSDVICLWNIGTCTKTTTATGTAVLGFNLNTGFSTTLAEATAFSDETAVADTVNLVLRYWTAITTSAVIDLSGVILGQNHYLQVNQETESNSGSAILIGHYENPS